jgi:hypothetical protein
MQDGSGMQEQPEPRSSYRSTVLLQLLAGKDKGSCNSMPQTDLVLDLGACTMRA